MNWKVLEGSNYGLVHSTLPVSNVTVNLEATVTAASTVGTLSFLSIN